MEDLNPALTKWASAAAKGIRPVNSAKHAAGKSITRLAIRNEIGA